MVIRHAQLCELDEILDIYAIAKRFMDEHGNKNQWSGDDAVKREKIEAFIENNQLFVGEEDGKIHFVFAYILGEDPTYKVIEKGSWLNEEPYGTVHRLASKGTAKGVVRTIANWALTQCSNLRIDTHNDNKVMQGALKNAGFSYCGIIYLESGDPRLAYQLKK